MDNKCLKYQISIFGSYEEIVPNMEVIKKFVETFSDKNLIPNQFEELSFDIKDNTLKSNKTTSRLRLTSADKSFNINFNSERIDFVLTNINVGVFIMWDTNAFIDEVYDILNKIYKIYPRKHKRIGFSRTNIIDGIDSDLVEGKINNNIEIFKNKKILDWSNRIATRLKIDKPHEEMLNVVRDFRMLNTNMMIKSKNSAFKGLLLSSDVNTVIEKNEYRFDVENVKLFLIEMSKIHEEVFSQTIKSIS